MSEVIFARPRYDYGSYSDLYRLIDLSGFKLIFFDEIDPQSDNAYILTMVNGENQNGWQDAKAAIILYDLEWRLDGEYPKIPGVREVWAADKWYAEKIGAKYVPLGSHVELPPEPLQECPKVYDGAMMSYMTYRREHIAVQLVEAGIRLAPKGWGMERHQTLQQTGFMLHVHQNDNIYTIAPQRWALAAAYRMPILTESVTDSGIFGKTHMMSADYPFIVDLVKMWKTDDRMFDYSLALHQLLCVDNNFRSFVERAL